VIRLEVVMPARLAGLAADWTALWERSSGASPFQRPEWLLPWYEHLSYGGGLALVAWRGDALAGLAPLHRWDEGGRRLVGLAGGPVSDYRDALADDSCRAEVAASLESHLARLADAAVLDDLPPGAILSGADAEPAQVCPELSLEGGLAATWARFAPRVARNLRYQRRRIDRDGDGAFVRGEAASAPALLEALFRFQEARFGAPIAGAIRRFHLAAARRLLAAGLLRLHALTVNGATAAVAHVLVGRRRAHLYQLAFDPALAPRSPGAILCARAIEDALHDGCVAFDFLRGGEPYKYSFGARDRLTTRRRVFGGRVTACAANME
jgi:CelD/BcsL family acetyltransferase involved in cellulose biosynthesis